jgi:hypothetical protein
MIVKANNLAWLRVNQREKVRCVFADVPDNIGLDYNGFQDRLPKAKYLTNLAELIRGSLTIADIFWLSYNAIYEWDMAELVKRYLSAWKVRKIIWYFTFGQYNKYDFTNCYRPILCFHAEWSPDLNFDAIRIASTRMVIGDKRAAGPRIPGDVWEYPRVAGNFKERRNWHPTQHPEALMERIVLLSCTETVGGRTQSIGKFVDLCLGSGTSGIVCNRLGVPWEGIEISDAYCAELSRLFNLPVRSL